MKSNKRRLLSNKKLHNIYNLKSLKKHRIKQKSAHRPKQFKFKQSGGYEDIQDALNHVPEDANQIYNYFTTNGKRKQQHRYHTYYRWLLNFAKDVFEQKEADDMVSAKDQTRSSNVVTKFENQINRKLLYVYNNLRNEPDKNKILDKYVNTYIDSTKGYTDHLDNMVKKLKDKYLKETSKAFMSQGSGSIFGKETSNIFNPEKDSPEYLYINKKKRFTDDYDPMKYIEKPDEANYKYKTKEKSYEYTYGEVKALQTKLNAIYNKYKAANPEYGSSLAVTAAGKVAGACADRVTAQKGGTLEGQLLFAVKLSDLNKESNEITLNCESLIEFLQQYKSEPAQRQPLQLQPGEGGAESPPPIPPKPPPNTYDDDDDDDAELPPRRPFKPRRFSLQQPQQLQPGAGGAGAGAGQRQNIEPQHEVSTTTVFADSPNREYDDEADNVGAELPPARPPKPLSFSPQQPQQLQPGAGGAGAGAGQRQNIEPQHEVSTTTVFAAPPSTAKAKAIALSKQNDVLSKQTFKVLMPHITVLNEDISNPDSKHAFEKIKASAIKLIDKDNNLETFKDQINAIILKEEIDIFKNLIKYVVFAFTDATTINDATEISCEKGNKINIDTIDIIGIRKWVNYPNTKFAKNIKVFVNWCNNENLTAIPKVKDPVFAKGIINSVYGVNGKSYTNFKDDLCDAINS